MKKTLYIDIETIPGPESGKDAIEVKPPAQMKKQETIDKWYAEKGDDAKEEAYRKQSFNGGYGQVCAFSFAVDDGEVTGHYIQSDRGDEAGLISGVFELIDVSLDGHNNPYACGHFVSGFDLRFLMHRCIVLGIRLPLWLSATANAAAWDDKVRDTMFLWAGARDTIGLDELCTILGIEGKGDVDGSMVYDMWLAGEYEKIGKYCDSDVSKVREINRKFVAAGL